GAQGARADLPAPFGVRRGARANARGARLLACAGVAMQRTALDCLVDGALHTPVLGVGSLRVAVLDGALQLAQIRLDRGGVVAVLQALALGAQDARLLGVDVGHGVRR